MDSVRSLSEGCEICCNYDTVHRNFLLVMSYSDCALCSHAEQKASQGELKGRGELIIGLSYVPVISGTIHRCNASPVQLSPDHEIIPQGHEPSVNHSCGTDDLTERIMILQSRTVAVNQAINQSISQSVQSTNQYCL